MEKVKWIVVILILFMAAGAGVYCWYLPQTHAADENNEPALEEGQEYAYAKITSILGNEMTYVELEAQAVDFNDLREKDGANENASGAKRDMAGQREERVSDGEKTSDGDMQNMPAAGAMPANSAAARAGRSGVQKNSAQDKTDYTQAAVMTYSETDVTGQIQIPVGTEVETKLGTITTFSRLSNGDIIKILLQKDDTGSSELMKIWIVE
ncbi:MAG: hypothetical protein HFH78_02490 [Lachnospiraceae bacterium]|nr:hypothetical protein [Lachnospiraceae bacterium]